MTRKFGIGIAMTFGVLVAGCGGGGGASATPTDVNGLVNAGTDKLNLTLSGGTIQQSDVKSAYVLFKQAYTADPNNPDAAMGYALTECVQAAADSAGVFVTGLFPTTASSNAHLNPFSGDPVATPAINSLQDAVPIGWQLQASSSKQPRLFGNVLPSTIRAILVALEPALSNVVTALSDSNLAALELKPMVLKMYVNGKLTNVQVGKAEGLVLRGAAEEVLGLVNLAVAYHLDYGTWNWNVDTLPPLGGKSGTLTYSSFLPGGTFAKLTTTGQASLKGFGTSTVAGLTDQVAAIDAQKARTTQTWLLGVMTTPAALVDDRANIVKYSSLLTAIKTITFTPTGSTASVTTRVNIPAWLSKAPADLRGLFSSLTVTRSATAVKITPTKATIKDRTYGGLFPDGITDTVLYGRTITLGTKDVFLKSDAAGFASGFLDSITNLK